MQVQSRRRAVHIDRDPYAVLLALRDRPGLFGLVGNWAGGGAVIGFDPIAVLSSQDDPFDVLAASSGGRATCDLVGGGWFGALGFGLGRMLEAYPPDDRPSTGLPGHCFAYYGVVLRQGDSGTWCLEWQSGTPPDHIDEVERRVLTAIENRDQDRDYEIGVFEPSERQATEHQVAVGRAIEYINAGDIFQVNVCLRLSARFQGDPLDAFCRAARETQPARGAFFRVGADAALASLSPELFVERRGTLVRTSPIKGTAVRRGSETEQQRSRRSLQTSSKDRAENLIIVDLMRNDVARVARSGSVRVEALNRVEPHPGVWHLVSDVVCEMDESVSDAELLRATFPPGSISGAPKKRAIEIIDELEQDRRGFYTGAIGFSSPTWGSEFSVAIRTFEFVAGEVRLGVGGGITTASRPDLEYAECKAKAAPLVAAMGADLRWLVTEDSTEPPVNTSITHQPLAFTPEAGQGVFTTILTTDGLSDALAEHQKRLANSVGELYSVSLPDLKALVAAHAPPVGRHALRVTASPSSDGCQINLETSPFTRRERDVVLSPVVTQDGLGRHKWCDRREIEALRCGAEDEDVLFLDERGHVLEGSRHNIFVVMDNRIVTPPADGRIVPGTMRQRVIKEAGRYRLPISEEAQSIDELTSASEVFLTNALDGVRPVKQIRGCGQWEQGPITRLFRGAVESTGRRSRPKTAHLAPPRARLLVIDNYDSFVHNLVDYSRQNGLAVDVIRNDEMTARDIIDAGTWDGILLSPGPARPEDAGICENVIRECGPTIAIFGICLGHQAIASALGGRVVRSPRPQHGRASIIEHDGKGIFKGLPSPMAVGRYHSLVVERATLPASLRVTAETAGGVVMGIAHQRWDVTGVQFHPESILTPWGHELVANFAARVRARSTLVRESQWPNVER